MKMNDFIHAISYLVSTYPDMVTQLIYFLYIMVGMSITRLQKQEEENYTTISFLRKNINIKFISTVAGALIVFDLLLKVPAIGKWIDSTSTLSPIIFGLFAEYILKYLTSTSTQRSIVQSLIRLLSKTIDSTYDVKIEFKEDKESDVNKIEPKGRDKNE